MIARFLAWIGWRFYDAPTLDDYEAADPGADA